MSNMLGGGIYNAGGSVTVSNSTLVGNAADTGGGIAKLRRDSDGQRQHPLQ